MPKATPIVMPDTRSSRHSSGITASSGMYNHAS
jgi:hypothetical protein